MHKIMGYVVCRMKIAILFIFNAKNKPCDYHSIQFPVLQNIKRFIINFRLYFKSHSVSNVLHYKHASSDIQLQMNSLLLSSKVQ